MQLGDRSAPTPESTLPVVGSVLTPKPAKSGTAPPAESKPKPADAPAGRSIPFSMERLDDANMPPSGESPMPAGTSSMRIVRSIMAISFGGALTKMLLVFRSAAR